MSRFLLDNSVQLGKGFFCGKLYQISWFPGAVLSVANTDKVHGTIFKMKNVDSVFKVLDEYEGYNANAVKTSLFKRVRITAYLKYTTKIEAWVYLYNGDISNYTQITSGDFLKK